MHLNNSTKITPNLVLIGLAVLTFIGFTQTDRQAKFIYRCQLYIAVLVVSSLCTCGSTSVHNNCWIWRNRVHSNELRSFPLKSNFKLAIEWSTNYSIRKRNFSVSDPYHLVGSGSVSGNVDMNPGSAKN